jgi:uncharacterized membrane protein
MEIFAVVANILVSIVLYILGPDKIPTHYNISGVADRYSDKLPAVLIFPIISILITILLKRIKSEYDMSKITIMTNILFVIINLTTLLYVMGYVTNVNRIIMSTMGIYLFLIGFLFKDIPQNRYAGIKVPWVYKSPENWRRTHDFGGVVFKIIGVIFGITGLMGILNGYLLFTLLFILIVLPIGYSYYLYTKGV